MYVITNKSEEDHEIYAEPEQKVVTLNCSQEEVREWLEPRNMRGVISDLDQIIEHNQQMRRIIAEKDNGKPGHYYGRDIMLEGAMPLAMFFTAPLEYGGDENWWKDDAKFQDYMKRNREAFSYLY